MYDSRQVSTLIRLAHRYHCDEPAGNAKTDSS